MSELDDLVPYLENVSQHGHYVRAECVFHDDSDPSMLVFSDGYNCLGCGAKGTLKRLKRALTGTKPRTLARATKRSPSPFWAFLRRFGGIQEIVDIAHSMSITQNDYFKRRKIDSMIQISRLGWLEGWYTFPIFQENGRLVSVVLRASPAIEASTGKRYILPHKTVVSDYYLYVPDWELINNSDYVILCFGIIDALTLASLGLPGLTWSAGKNVPPAALDQFRKPIFIIPDSNEELDAHKLAGSLGWRGHAVNVDYPIGTKDLNDLHLEGLLNGNRLARCFGSGGRVSNGRKIILEIG